MSEHYTSSDRRRLAEMKTCEGHSTDALEKGEVVLVNQAALAEVLTAAHRAKYIPGIPLTSTLQAALKVVQVALEAAKKEAEA